MDKDADMVRNTCGSCRNFCLSQIYREFGYCRLYNGKKGKHLLPRVGEACEKFSPR